MFRYTEKPIIRHDLELGLLFDVNGRKCAFVALPEVLIPGLICASGQFIDVKDMKFLPDLGWGVTPGHAPAGPEPRCLNRFPRISDTELLVRALSRLLPAVFYGTRDIDWVLLGRRDESLGLFRLGVSDDRSTLDLVTSLGASLSFSEDSFDAVQGSLAGLLEALREMDSKQSYPAVNRRKKEIRRRWFDRSLKVAGNLTKARIDNCIRHLYFLGKEMIDHKLVTGYGMRRYG